MDYGRLFSHTWHIVRHNRIVWLIGFVASLGSSGGGIARLLLGVTPGAWPGLSRLPWLLGGGGEVLPDVPVIAWFDQPAALLWGAAGFFLLAVLLWLVVTTAEGALIAAVLGIEAAEPLTLPQAAVQGWRWLGRFIAIDTVLFFPLFLLVLVAMLVVIIALLVLGLAVGQAASSTALVAPVLLAAACLLLLLCLMLPVTVGTLLWRTLAFRDTAICGHGVRASIRHSGQVIRRQAVTVLVLAVLLGGGRYLLSLFLSVLTLPLTAILVINRLPGLLLAFGLGVGLVVAHSLVHAFTATAWTLAYQGMQNDER